MLRFPDNCEWGAGLVIENHTIVSFGMIVYSTSTSAKVVAAPQPPAAHNLGHFQESHGAQHLNVTYHPNVTYHLNIVPLYQTLFPLSLLSKISFSLI